MLTCTKCDGEVDDESLLSGSDVYGVMASGNDRDDLLATYTGIKYGQETLLCAECLDTPSECFKCDGTGEVRTELDGTETTELCTNCDGTGTSKPDLLRISCKHSSLIRAHLSAA